MPAMPRAFGLEFVYDHYVNDNVHFFTNFTRTAPASAIRSTKTRRAPRSRLSPATFQCRHGLECNRHLEADALPACRREYYDSTSKSGRSAFGPYQILNLKIEKTLIRSDSHTIVLFTDLNNLTNRRYLMPWQFRDPGFNVLGGLDFRF